MILTMTLPRRIAFLIVTIAALLGLASCGSDADSTSAADAVDDSEVSSDGSSAGSDEDHSDEADADEDHDDEAHDDEDHEGEDHGDKEHDDEDHDDDDHGDEDHDDGHEDEAHADEDHDDDHGDEDHDHDDDDHDDASAGLGAHEHGVAELFVAWSGADLIVDLVSPAFNIVGFENEPTTDEELAVVADRTEALTTPGIISINDAAGCALVGDVATETEFEGSHAEITASWSFACDNPDGIEQLEAAELFAEFPNLEDIDAQWASDTGQSSAELTPSATTLAFG